MDITTIKRHLLAAVYTLGTDVETIEQRLRKVYEGDLLPIAANPDLLARLRSDFEVLMADLSDLLAARSRIDLKRASLLARQVVLFYQQVATEL